MKAQWFYVLLTIAAGRTILLSPIEMFQEMCMFLGYTNTSALENALSKVNHIIVCP